MDLPPFRRLSNGTRNGGVAIATSAGIPLRSLSRRLDGPIVHRRSLTQSSTPFLSPKAVTHTAGASGPVRDGVTIASSDLQPFLNRSTSPENDTAHRRSRDQA